MIYYDKDEQTGICMLVATHSDQAQDCHKLERGTENNALYSAIQR